MRVLDLKGLLHGFRDDLEVNLTDRGIAVSNPEDGSSVFIVIPPADIQPNIEIKQQKDLQ